MGVLDAIFGRELSLEEELEEVYATVLNGGFGLTCPDSRPLIKEWIGKAKAEFAEVGEQADADLYQNEDYITYLQTEGVTPQDVNEWMEITPLERKIMLYAEQWSCQFITNKFIDQGMTLVEAQKEYGRAILRFGTWEEIRAEEGNDRLLPFELKARVNLFFAENGVPADDGKFSSANALVRHLIKNKVIK